jgi:hypothetical protein
MEAVFEAVVPFFGGVARAVREGMENVAGTPFAALHVSLANNGEINKHLVAGIKKRRGQA